MRNKIIGGIIAACITVAATVPPKQNVDPNNLSFEQAVYFCADAYADYKRTKKMDYFERGLALLPTKQSKDAVSVVCAAYAIGYGAGEESMVRRT